MKWPRRAGRGGDVVITMLPGRRQVQDLLLGPDGLLGIRAADHD